MEQEIAAIRASKVIEVRIISRRDDLSLVQWSQGGIPQRAWVTPDMIVSVDEKNGKAMVESPKAGIPYGVEWSRIVELNVSPEEMEKNLKAQGIWTVADLRNNPDGARAALQATYGIDLGALFRATKEL